MLKEAMAFITELAGKSVVHEFRDINEHTTITTCGDKRELLVCPPDTPRRSILSLEDMRAYVMARKGLFSGHSLAGGVDIESVYDVGSEGSVIFYSVNGIEYIEQPHDKRGITATMELHYTDAYKAISECKWLSQKDFLRMLRIDLRGCMPNDMLATAMAKVVFKTQSAGASTVVQGRQSMSRELLQSINDESSFPEEYTFVLDVFDEVKLPVSIDCAIEVDMEKNIFKITPFTNSIKDSVNHTMEHIASRLKEACPKCYFGSFSV